MSFTHLIGFAVVRALGHMPAMNSSFVEGDQPKVVHHDHVGLGLAVDVTKSDGSHTLLVPCIRDADTLDFRNFWQNYEELIRKVRTGKIGVDDFAGTTVTLTNPGTIGTVHSVPRLMPGQGVIVGVGALDFPAEYQAADPRMLAQLGISKVITITSTYDHRIIQGAESGEFLGWVHKLLLGEDDFYDDVFRAMGVPYEPVRWRRDTNAVDEEKAQLAKQVYVQTLINMYRVRGHLIADLDPLAAKEPHTHAELDPATYGLTIWDLDREFYADGLAGRDVMTLGRDPRASCAMRTAAPSASSTCTSRSPIRSGGSRSRSRASAIAATPDEQRWILSRLNAAEAFEKFLHTKYVGQKRFGLEGGESAIPLARHGHRRGGGQGARRGRHRHGASRPAERARQHRRQELPRAVQGVRGRPRSRHRPGIGRREVPQGRDRASSSVRRTWRSRSRWRRTRRTSRRSTRSSRAWCAPSRTCSTAPPVATACSAC